MENGSAGSPPAAAACCPPPWVMLHHYGYQQDSIVAEAKTTAAATWTSTNLPFHVSLLPAALPASAMMHYGWCDNDSALIKDADGKEEVKIVSVTVIATHGGAALVEVISTRKGDQYDDDCDKIWDYFLYETGTARSPPSLLKLPGRYFPHGFHPDKDSQRVMGIKDTGILRCGVDDDDEQVFVAKIEVSDDDPRDRADLCILRVGQEWEHKRAVPILFGDHHPGSTSNVALSRQWQADTVIAVGDRYLCWVDYNLGFLFCDMAADDQSLKLRYVTLPVLPPEDVEYWDGRPYERSCRNVAGAGGGAVRFVSIEPRCCCGGHGRSTCARGWFLFTVTTWTLSLSMEEPMQWVKDGVLDCTELWALQAYKGLPQVRVRYPIVSLDNADVIWFVVREDVQDYDKFSERRVWMVEVDTRAKALLSVVPCEDSRMGETHIAVKLRC